MADVAVLADVSNLYYCVQKRYSRKLDYRKLVTFIQEIGDPVIMKAYGAQMHGEATGFISALQSCGFETHFKTPKEYTSPDGGIRRKADWDVGIALDMLKLPDTIKYIILCTADGDMSLAVAEAQAQGKRVVVIGSGISGQLAHQADEAIEIPQSLLERGRRS